LLPALVLLFDMLSVALHQFRERVAAALGLPLGKRVLAANDVEHDLCRDLASIGQTDDTSAADVDPARLAVKTIHGFEGLLVAGLDAQAQAALISIPHCESSSLTANCPDESVGQLLTAGGSRRQSIFAWPWHFFG
jgi:hypothetical protein